MQHFHPLASEIGASFQDAPPRSPPRKKDASPSKSAILQALGEELNSQDDNNRNESMVSLNSSTASNWFENTHDEMLLYEK